MLIRLLSDIHLEFDLEGSDEDFVIPRIPGEDEMVLVLAGDITANMDVVCHAPHWWSVHTNWVKSAAIRHKAVVFVCGNHEFYHGHMKDVREWWRNVDASVQNFHFLDNSLVVIDGVRFVGGTLWTSLRNGNPLTMLNVVDKMNDFKYITVMDRGVEKPFTAEDWLSEHYATTHFLETELANPFEGKTVVVSHHLPSFQSVSNEYIDKDNDGYASNLDSLILDNNIDLWFHGHTHESVDYMIEDTRVVCNPRGYNSYPPVINKTFDPTMVIKLET